METVEPVQHLLSIFQPLHFGVLMSMLVMAVLLVCSALISGSEIAYFSLSKTDLDELKKSDDKFNTKIYQLIDKPNSLLATILVANNFINIAIIILSTFIVNGVLNNEILSPQTIVC